MNALHTTNYLLVVKFASGSGSGSGSGAPSFLVLRRRDSALLSAVDGWGGLFPTGASRWPRCQATWEPVTETETLALNGRKQCH